MTKLLKEKIRITSYDINGNKTTLTQEVDLYPEDMIEVFTNFLKISNNFKGKLAILEDDETPII